VGIGAALGDPLPQLLRADRPVLLLVRSDNLIHPRNMPQPTPLAQARPRRMPRNGFLGVAKMNEPHPPRQSLSMNWRWGSCKNCSSAELSCLVFRHTPSPTLYGFAAIVCNCWDFAAILVQLDCNSGAILVQLQCNCSCPFGPDNSGSRRRESFVGSANGGIQIVLIGKDWIRKWAGFEGRWPGWQTGWSAPPCPARAVFGCERI
jgi:hypothetical protein